jgi:hypothetical protein
LKRPLTEWEKIFTNSCTSDKGPITIIYQNPKILNSQKINDLMKNCINGLKNTFLKEKVQMAKKHMKKCSPSKAIKEM